MPFPPLENTGPEQAVEAYPWPLDSRAIVRTTDRTIDKANKEVREQVFFKEMVANEAKFAARNF